MPTLIFTTGNDSYDVTTAETFDLAFLAGDDILRLRNAGATTTAFMGEGNDAVYHRAGTATVDGESGSDRFEVYASGLTANGGADGDLFNLRGGSGQVLSGGLGDDRFTFVAVATGIVIHGDAGHDDFAGYDHAVTGNIYGDDGNDLFTGFRAGVTLRGGPGNDIYRVNPLSNAAFVEAAAGGTDIVQLMRGADYVLPDNIERIIVGSYAGGDTTSATITMNGLANTFTGHGNVETVNGLAGNDRLYGSGGDDTLNGDDGNDLLHGGGGNDTLNGGAGNDQLVGRTGNDTMAGGLGNDTYYVDDAGDVVVENPGEGTDLIRSSIGYNLPNNVENGLLTGAFATSMDGNAGNNTITGNASNNTLVGRAGNDALRGGNGNDSLWGDTIFSIDDTGDDRIIGGAGNDTIVGGPGFDTLTGGSGSDTFGYLHIVDSLNFPGDRITDFVSASGEGSDDQIDLSFVDATAADGQQHFMLVGAFNGTAGQLVITDDPGSNTVWIQGDVDGDSFPDFTITVNVTGGTFFTDDLTL